MALRTKVPVGVEYQNIPANLAKLRREIQQQLGNVNIKLTANSKGFQKAEVSMRKVAESTKQATSFMDDFANKSALAFKRYTAFSLATFGFLRFTRGISSAFDEAIKFERELVRISQVSDKPLSSLGRLQKQIFDLSTTFGNSSTELAESARVLAQAGFSIDEIDRTLRTLAKTDVAPNFKNLKDSTEATIAIMRQFGIEANHIDKAFDAINKSASAFAFEAEDITAAVKRAGSTFSEAGGQFDEFIALFGSIRQRTRQAPETIATSLRTLIPRLQRKRTNDLLETFGISIRGNVNGRENQFIGPLKALEAIAKGIERIGDVRDPRVFEIIEQIGGLRRVESVIPILTDFDNVLDVLNVTRKEGNSLDKDAAIAQQSLEIQLKKLREEFQRLFTTVEQNSALRGLISQVTQLATALAQLANFVAGNDILSSLLVGGGSVLAARGLASFGSKTASKFFTARNTGGPIPGRGPNKDDQLIAVTGGEYVLRRKAVDKIGVGNLNRLNQSGDVAKVAGFVDGGYVKEGYRVSIGKDGKKYYFGPDGKRVSASVATTNSPQLSRGGTGNRGSVSGSARATGGILLGGTNQPINRTPIVSASGEPVSSTPPPKKPAPTAVGLRGTAAIRQEQEVFGPPRPSIVDTTIKGGKRRFFSPEEKLQQGLNYGFSSKISSSGQRIFQDPQGKITSFDKAINPNSEFGKERLTQIKKNIEAQSLLTKIHESENQALKQRVQNEIALAKSRDVTTGLTREQVLLAAKTRISGVGAGGGAFAGGDGKNDKLFRRQQELSIAEGRASAIPFTAKERGQLAAVRTGGRLSQFGRGVGQQLGRPIGAFSRTRLGQFSQSTGGRVAGFGDAAAGFIGKSGSKVAGALAGVGRAVFPALIAQGVTQSLQAGLEDKASSAAQEGDLFTAQAELKKSKGIGVAGAAATGALIGSAIPVIGTAFGALAGTMVGLASETETFDKAMNFLGFDIKTTAESIKEAEDAVKAYNEEQKKQKELADLRARQEQKLTAINEIIIAGREREINAIRNITKLQTAFGAASRSLEPILNTLNNRSVASRDASGLLSAASSGDIGINEFGQLDKVLRNSLSGTGPLGGAVGQAAFVESIANKIIPDVIDRTALTSLRNPGTEEQPFDLQGVFLDDLSNSLRAELPEKFGVAITDFVSRAGSRIFSNQAEDFARFSPENRQKTVDLAIDSTNLQAIEAVIKAQADKNQALDQIFERRLEVEKNGVDAINRANDIRLGFFKEQEKLFGRDVDPGFIKSLDKSRLENILGGVSGTGLRDIVQTNRGAQARLSQIQGGITGVPSDQERQAAEEQIRIIDRTTRALEELANNSNRAADIQERLSKLEEQRLTKRDFASKFAFGSGEDRREIAASIQATQQAARSGSLEGLSETQRAGVGQLLSEFENVKSRAFGINERGEALTGGQLRDKLLGSFTGLKEGLTEPSKEEKKLVGELGGVVNTQALATELLATIGNEGQKLAQAAIDINKVFAETVEKNLSGSLNANVVKPLVDALKSIPSEIQGNFNHQVEVIFNGAEVFQALLPQISEIATKQAAKTLNKFIGDNFPELPQIHPGGKTAATTSPGPHPNLTGD